MHRLLPTPSWEPKKLGFPGDPRHWAKSSGRVHNPPQTNNNLQVSTTGGTHWYISIAAALPLPLPSPSEQGSPNKPQTLALLSSGAKTGRQPTSRARPKTKVWLKKRNEISYCSRRGSVLNIHNQLEIVDFRDNCRLWEQVQGGVRPDLRLSWPHTANNRSRDFPRNIGRFWCECL